MKISMKSSIWIVLTTTLLGIEHQGCHGQEDDTAALMYFDTPVMEWKTRISPVQEGMGIFLSPTNDELVFATSMDGTVSALERTNGNPRWTYGPPTTDTGFAFSGTSGITFVQGSDQNGGIDFLTYAVLENENSNDPTMSRVVAVTMSGEELWVSDLLQGVPSGSPMVSEDGNYLFLTHNSEFETVGHFTVLDVAGNGAIFFSQKNNTAPFAPVGIYHSPKEGYYQGGENNRNDILVWSVRPKPEDTTVGDGATFGFQFPIGFSDVADNLGYTLLGSSVDFQTISRPVFANNGLSMYWGTSRSQFRVWVGQEGLNRYRFNQPRTATVGFSRGNPAGQAIFSPLALSGDQDALSAFGGTAANEFVRLNYDFSEQILVDTSSVVKTEARISPDNQYVYYAEFNGKLHQARFDDLSDHWVYELQAPVEAEFALTADGTTLYVADIAGFVTALRVADLPSTGNPSEVPSDMPSNYPTSSPVVATNSPTRMPAAPTPPAPNAAPPTDTAAPTGGLSGGGSSAATSFHPVILKIIAFMATIVFL